MRELRGWLLVVGVVANWRLVDGLVAVAAKRGWWLVVAVEEEEGREVKALMLCNFYLVER